MDSTTAPKDAGAEDIINSGVSRGHRLAGLLLVCFVAFAYPLLNSTLYFLLGSGVRPRSFAPGEVSFWFYFGIITELIALLVLVLVLRRQRRTLRHLRLSFTWKDLPESLLLAIGTYIVFVQFYVLLFYIYYAVTGRAVDATPQNIEHLKTKITLAAVLLMLVNPFYEELIARAYVITEVQFLTGSRLLALVASVTLQSAYHLYQGVVSASMLAVMFAIFSVYFIMRRKILPIILAHMYFDFLALLSNAQY
jgi:membrane protease YdiL (CAAX protease family)